MKPIDSTSVSRTAGAGRSTPRSRRRLPWIIGLALLTLVIAGLWPKALPVEISSVSRGDLIVTVNEEGMTRVKNRYMISSPVAGQLQRIDWKPGAIVEAGQTVLAVLETSEADLLDTRGQAQAEARVHAAEANQALAGAQVERARAAHTLAETELMRFRELANHQVISKQELDAATMRESTAAQELRATEFARQVSAFELEQARAILSRGHNTEGKPQPPLVIHSPINGRVLRVYQESARLVPAGWALLEVGDPTDLELRIEVLSRDAVAIRPGARVIVEQWGGAQPLEGRVRVVEPSAFTKISALGVEEQRVYVVADLVDGVGRRPTLGDNYRIEGRVVVSEGTKVLRVPAGSLFQRAGEWQTFVVSGGRATLRTVKIGKSNGLMTEITEGLTEGQNVIVYPGDKVADGVRITPVVIGTEPTTK